MPATPAEPSSGTRAYARLLRTPGSVTLALSGMIGRFPIAMRSLACLLLIPAYRGSLADAGVVAAAILLSQGLMSPVLGRLADRIGQRRTLLTALPANVLAISLLPILVIRDAPLWLLTGVALATGATSVSFSSFMRARWATLVEPGLLRAAYALESMLDETIFLLGPLLVTVLVATVHPAAGLLACAVLTAVGSVAVALHRRSAPVLHPPASRGSWGAITVGGVRVLTVAYAGMGFLLGAVDVALVAFAREHDAPGLSGVFLSLTAVGSLIAGAVYGAVNWRVSERRLLVGATTVLTVGVIPLVFVGSTPVMLPFAVLAGIAIAPALIAGSTLLESVAPRGSLSEAFSWLTSAGALGIALGTATGGQLGDHRRAALAAIGGGAVALVLSLLGQSALGTSRPAPDAVPAPAHHTVT